MEKREHQRTTVKLSQLLHKRGLGSDDVKAHLPVGHAIPSNALPGNALSGNGVPFQRCQSTPVPHWQVSSMNRPAAHAEPRVGSRGTNNSAMMQPAANSIKEADAAERAAAVEKAATEEAVLGAVALQRCSSSPALSPSLSPSANPSNLVSNLAMAANAVNAANAANAPNAANAANSANAANAASTPAFARVPFGYAKGAIGIEPPKRQRQVISINR